MITAGGYDEHALSVLARPDSRSLFDQLLREIRFHRRRFGTGAAGRRYLLLGQHVDAALFSILRDVSQLPKIHAARERMTALGVPILGCRALRNECRYPLPILAWLTAMSLFLVGNAEILAIDNL